MYACTCIYMSLFILLPLFTPIERQLYAIILLYEPKLTDSHFSYYSAIYNQHIFVCVLNWLTENRNCYIEIYLLAIAKCYIIMMMMYQQKSHENYQYTYSIYAILRLITL